MSKTEAETGNILIIINKVLITVMNLVCNLRRLDMLGVEQPHVNKTSEHCS
jgi:hypothetical protein